MKEIIKNKIKNYQIFTITILVLMACKTEILVQIDCAYPWQMGFQDPATPIIIGIINLHDQIMVVLVIVCTFVFWILFRAMFKFINNSNPVIFVHSTPLEITWTIIPALLLLYIAGPSFALLYAIEDCIQADITLKVIGHQWYWSYEYNTHKLSLKDPIGFVFDSYIVSEDELTLGGLRLLEVDYRTKLPINHNIQVIVTSADVLHSWAIPSLGVKIDACPGRLNQIFINLFRTGVFYGQCSEICGINHGFIPIVVEGVKKDDYLKWAYKNLIAR
jgi:cytochrome c oxidase subunit 2